MLSNCGRPWLIKRMYIFVFRGRAAPNVESSPAFRQTLQFSSSGWIWRIQFQCLPKHWITFNIRRGSSLKAEVAHWTRAAKSWGQESGGDRQQPKFAGHLVTCWSLESLFYHRNDYVRKRSVAGLRVGGWTQ